MTFLSLTHSARKAVQLTCLIVLVGLSHVSITMAVSVDSHPALQKIASDLVAEGVYSQDELNTIFAQAEIQQPILDAMKNPAESKFTWGRYRKIFMRDDRIQNGVEFWQEHVEALSKAQAEFGVPAEIIVAIIAVESKFGRYKGSHKVIDSLVSLVVDFPRRSAFFAGELKHFLILCKENDLDPTQVLGSYAGAMGYPQFIASSYRRFAVDFSGDGKTDLIDQPQDAIGSVANYFVENGWLRGEPVTSAAFEQVPSEVAALASRKRMVAHTASYLRGLGAPIDEQIAGSEKLGVLMLDASETVNEPSTSGIYIVQVGDTACQIAEAHSVPCRQLMSDNNLDAKGKIYRGQRLKLPKSKQSSNTESSATADSSATDGGSKSSESSRWKINSINASKQPVEPAPEVMERYFFTHMNFYVITRYNQSVLYAMAVNELSQAIRSKYNETVFP